MRKGKVFYTQLAHVIEEGFFLESLDRWLTKKIIFVMAYFLL